ncbi:hypothetical protein PAMA_015160 [Pampus argenteus]
MEKLLLLMVMFASCYATPQDLSGKLFVLPMESNTNHVKLLTDKTLFRSTTVCLRFLTDLTRSYGLFSLSTPSHTNAFALIKMKSTDVIRVYALNSRTDFLSLSFPPNTWHSMCATWCSDSGLAQLWVDGKPTIKRFIKSGQPIAGTPITILGQEQDSYGGGFDGNQSFIGMISKVHMWDYVLSTTEIQGYVTGEYFTPGNVVNWRALEYEISGMILVE